jgi:hypothetical protein
MERYLRDVSALLKQRDLKGQAAQLLNPVKSHTESGSCRTLCGIEKRAEISIVP